MFAPLSFYPNSNSINLDRARQLAAQRAKRAQWLPDEYDDDDVYDRYQLSPYERAYLNAHRNQVLMERERQRREQELAEARRRELEEQRWQRDLDRRQREDEEVRRRLVEERERRRQSQQVPRSSSQPRTIPITTPDGRVPSPQPQTKAATQRPTTPTRQPSPPSSQYTEKHAEAAATLQRFFRIRKSLRTIESLSSEFDAVRRDFTRPCIISFQNPGSLPSSSEVVDVSVISPPLLTQSSTDDSQESNPSYTSIPKLAFNSTNYSLHSYTEALDKLLVKLDGVESWGDADVRTRRRGVVKQIEEEQSTLDKLWRMSWLEHMKERPTAAGG